MMSRGTDNQADEASRQPGDPARVLVVGARASRDLLAAKLAGSEAPAPSCAFAGSLKEAIALLERESFEVALISSVLPDGDGFELSGWIGRKAPGVAAIVVTQSPTLDDAMRAMRCGCADLVSADATGAELAERIGGAALRSARARQREARGRRLREICREMHKSRQELSARLGAMCQDLAEAYGEITTRATLGAVGGEFNGIIRQELDIESVLRAALEFVLAKSGPTNAAVFLPSASGDFSLGAYVNYDHPRDTAEVLLDHLSAALAPKFEDQTGVTVLSGKAELERGVGECAEWIGDSNLIVIPCRHEGECLAVVALFRSSRQAFGRDLITMLPTIADLFARQLGRVIKIHHRHVPKHKWGAGDAEDLDLSA